MRTIAKYCSIRSAGRVYKAGDEDALHEQLSKEEVARLTGGVHPPLLGDWSNPGNKGANRELQIRRKQSERDPLTRAMKNALEATLADTDDDDEPGPVDEEYATPIQMRFKGGGWYGYYDADDEPVLGSDGKPIQVQGEARAQRRAEVLNTRYEKKSAT